MGHLNGVAAAQTGGLRALLAFEPLEAPAPAARAVDLAQERRDLDAARDILPDVDVDQIAIDAVELPRQALERLGRLEAGDNADERPKNPGTLAGAGLARRRGRLEDAAKAGRLPWKDRHRLAMAADLAGGDPCRREH